jgi:hypothetical protein
MPDLDPPQQASNREIKLTFFLFRSAGRPQVTFVTWSACTFSLRLSPVLQPVQRESMARRVAGNL